uniref:Odorant receptor 20 n=1 Tax=Eucryptorrhynchus brandti TaxID=436910 RepID=A0A8F4MXN1_EUCBR|nr:odorant receptor 20 [Eucryptorrhynchus brandti]
MIWDEIIRNYTITSFHFFALIKCFFLRGKIVDKIFKKIIKYEKEVYKSDNQDLKSLYNSGLVSVRNTRTYHLGGIVLVIIFYIISSALEDSYYVQKGNETVIVPRLPLSSWTPWDDSSMLSFAGTSLTGTYLCVFFVTADMTSYSLVLFGICQIKILRHYISHFARYSKEIQRATGHSKWHSCRLHQRKCLIIHQEIVSYVTDLNSVLKSVMLLDFVPSSVQLAGVIYQMMLNFNIIQGILVGQFVCTLIARIFVFCNSANELCVHSLTIADAWYEIDWTDLPPDVKRNILISIAKSQRPLCIGIGNFQDISLETFLVILKGAYSYMMLLTTT